MELRLIFFPFCYLYIDERWIACWMLVEHCHQIKMCWFVDIVGITTFHVHYTLNKWNSIQSVFFILSNHCLKFNRYNDIETYVDRNGEKFTRERKMRKFSAAICILLNLTVSSSGASNNNDSHNSSMSFPNKLNDNCSRVISQQVSMVH